MKSLIWVYILIFVHINEQKTCHILKYDSFDHPISKNIIFIHFVSMLMVKKINTKYQKKYKRVIMWQDFWYTLKNLDP